MRRRLSNFLALASIAAFVCIVCSAVRAQAPVNFSGKTVAIIVGSPGGGGTDLSARALSSYLSNYLPGHPSIIINNMPGADGLIAMNSFVQRTKPDGLTLVMGAVSSADPLLTHRPQSHFNPTSFPIAGGLRLGRNFLVIRADAEKRLYDKSLPPVVMGAIGSFPRTSQQMAAWGIAYLGWNARWVVGYRGTQDVLVALERGEIDMTATTGGIAEVQRLVESGVVKILVQTAAISSHDNADNIPVFAKLMEGKIDNKVEQQSFAYWMNLTLIDKWLALPPDTPAEIVQTYRQAYERTMQDPEFMVRVQAVSGELAPQTAAEVKQMIDSLDAIPPDAIEQITIMLRKQGLESGQ
jgi:tripartite-type tricarboxylate transporter receptor subunit TctC